MNGRLKPQSERTKEHDCGSCNEGFKLVNNVCEPSYEGSCANSKQNRRQKNKE